MTTHYHLTKERPHEFPLPNIHHSLQRALGLLLVAGLAKHSFGATSSFGKLREPRPSGKLCQGHSFMPEFSCPYFEGWTCMRNCDTVTSHWSVIYHIHYLVVKMGNLRPAPAIAMLDQTGSAESPETSPRPFRVSGLILWLCKLTNIESTE